MSVRKPKKQSSSRAAPTRKSIHTHYDHFGGHSGQAQTYEIISPLPKTKKWESWVTRHKANYQLLQPIASEVRDLIIDNPKVLDYWRKQVRAAYRKLSKQKTQQPITDTKDIQVLYVILAEVHDDIIKYEPIITTPKIRILYNPKMCETYLRYVKRDLKTKELLEDKNRAPMKISKKKKDKTKKVEDDPRCYLWQKQGKDSHGKNLWRIKYDNKEGDFAFEFCETIFKLLQQPNQPLLLTDLDNGLTISLKNISSEQPVADKQAQRDCLKELKEIDCELDKAKRNNDEAFIGRLEQEKDQLWIYLKQARGPQRQSKSLNSRKNLIKNSEDKFKKQQKRLLEAFVNSDLRELSVHFTGAISWIIDKKSGLPAIKYTPESHISWKFSL